jgi:uncharacterized membrane protein (UPF0127 family)
MAGKKFPAIISMLFVQNRSIFSINQIVPSRITKLAASANISHDAVDPCIFFFKDLLERGI